MGLYSNISALFSEPFVDGIVVHRFDRVAIVFSKCLYLILRVSLRALIGKKKRDRFIRSNQLSYRGILKRIHHKPMLIRVGDDLFWCRMEGDNITDFAVISDRYEPWFQAIFKPKVGDLVLDIGAHIGKYSVMASKSVGAGGKVIAIEADPDNFKLLRLNIETNHLQDRVYAINAAAWNEVTTISLFRDVFSGRHSVYKRAENSILINTVTVDELVQHDGLTKIDWMKVDIEGAEYAVLLGAKETIATKKLKLLLLEVHNRETLNLIRQLLSTSYAINIVKEEEDGRYFVVASLLSDST